MRRNRKYRKKMNSNRLIIFLGLFTFLFMGVGYSALTTTLNFNVSAKKHVSVAYEIGDMVYFNPKTGKACSSSDYWTTTNTSSECFRWFVITPNDTTSNTTVELLLDHNLANDVYWSWNDTISGPTVAMMELDNYTSSYKNVITYDFYSPEFLYPTCSDSFYQLPESGANKARLISTKDLYNITGDEKFLDVSTLPDSGQIWPYDLLASNLSVSEGYWMANASGSSSSCDSAYEIYADNYNTVKFRLKLVMSETTGLRPIIKTYKYVIS